MSRRTRLLAPLVVVAGLVAGGSAAHGAVPAPQLTVPAGATLKVAGRGFGHGHGMSQYGAQGAAEQGRSTGQILGFYYPHTKAGRVGGSVKVLLTASIGKATTIVARPGLRVHDLRTGRTTRVPTRGPASQATRWRMTGDGSGGTAVAYRTRAWHVWRTMKGDGEFRSTGAPLTLVLGGSKVSYRGVLRSMGAISRTTHRITVNMVSLEGYVQGVVPREMPSSWRPAALRAQAVAARTYAAFEARDSSDPRYNLCDSTSCQVYGGLSAEVASTNRATAATAGQVRTYEGQPAFTQFSASNGGWTADGGKPYLPAQKDPYDTASVDPYTAWSVKVPAARVQKAYNSATDSLPDIGTLKSISVTQRDGNGQWNGRVLTMKLVGSKNTVTVSGDDFRSRLGLRSTWFNLTIAG